MLAGGNEEALHTLAFGSDTKRGHEVERQVDVGRRDQLSLDRDLDIPFGIRRSK